MYDSPANNYGTGITANRRPLGTVTRSLASTSGAAYTGDRTRDAMARAQADLSRNKIQGANEQANNDYFRKAEQVRSQARMSLLNNLFAKNKLEAQGQMDDANRTMQKQQEMAKLAESLRTGRISDQWQAINTYTKAFFDPSVSSLQTDRDSLLKWFQRGGSFEAIPSARQDTLTALTESIK